MSVLLFPHSAQLASKEGYLIKLGAVVKVTTNYVYYQYIGLVKLYYHNSIVKKNWLYWALAARSTL